MILTDRCWATGAARGVRLERLLFGTLKILPAGLPEDTSADLVGKVAGFSLRAEVLSKVDRSKKLTGLCGYISRSAVSEKCLMLTPSGNIRY